MIAFLVFTTALMIQISLSTIVIPLVLLSERFNKVQVIHWRSLVSIRLFSAAAGALVLGLICGCFIVLSYLLRDYRASNLLAALGGFVVESDGSDRSLGRVAVAAGLIWSMAAFAVQHVARDKLTRRRLFLDTSIRTRIRICKALLRTETTVAVISGLAAFGIWHEVTIGVWY